MTARSCGPLAGTHAGVNRHRRAWEKPCRECARFAAEYARNRRASGEPRARARRASARRDWAIRALILRHRAEYAQLLVEARTAIPEPSGRNAS